jgi:hypothetical protein
MRARRATLVVAIATFVVATIVASLVLGNALGANSCAVWAGYVPIGSCVTTFWSAAFYLGPAIGLLAGVGAALLTDRATRRVPRPN